MHAQVARVLGFTNFLALLATLPHLSFSPDNVLSSQRLPKVFHSFSCPLPLFPAYFQDGTTFRAGIPESLSAEDEKVSGEQADLK